MLDGQIDFCEHSGRRHVIEVYQSMSIGQLTSGETMFVKFLFILEFQDTFLIFNIFLKILSTREKYLCVLLLLLLLLLLLFLNGHIMIRCASPSDIGHRKYFSTFCHYVR